MFDLVIGLGGLVAYCSHVSGHLGQCLVGSKVAKVALRLLSLPTVQTVLLAGLHSMQQRSLTCGGTIYESAHQVGHTW